MKHREVFMTTTDNPYDFFKDFDSWYRYDTEKGYNTCNILARLSTISDEESELNISDDLENAIDSFIKNDPSGIYRKIESFEEDKYV